MKLTRKENVLRKLLLAVGLLALLAAPQVTTAQDAPSIDELFNYLKGTWRGSTSGRDQFKNYYYFCHYGYRSRYAFTFEKVLTTNPRSAFLNNNKTAQISGRYEYVYDAQVDSVTGYGQSVREYDFENRCNLDVVGGGKVANKKLTHNIVLWPTARASAAMQGTTRACFGNNCSGEASGQVMERKFEFIDDNQMYYISGDSKILLKRSE